MVKWYRFGRTAIQISRPDNMTVPENMGKFEITEPNSDDRKVYYEIEFTDDIKSYSEKYGENEQNRVLVRRINLMVLSTPTGECRHLYFLNPELPYAVSLQMAEDKWKVWVSADINSELHWDTVFVAMLSLEKHMFANGDMILHTAFLCHDGQAILFSGPSEIGKSTQAGLWEKYTSHSHTVNGDRGLLMKENGVWYVCGWPICGSSGICNNEKYPVKAIVMLRQAKQNHCELLRGVQAFRELLPQITVNTWNSAFQLKAMDNIEDLINNIDVYELFCNISPEAVECLKEKIYG